LPAYLTAIRPHEGLVVVDDTQALGILGATPGPRNPYGLGGGGILSWSREGYTPDVIVIASLAKGFGVPVAVLASSAAQVDSFINRSETRVHCSPPSVAVIHAAANALALNRSRGARARRRLAALVQCFRESVKAIGLAAAGGLFPVQRLLLPKGVNAVGLYARLLRHNVHTVLQQGRSNDGATVTFVLNARHTPRDIHYAVGILASVLCSATSPGPGRPTCNGQVRLPACVW
jgi:8-amino-7-oxononanoate synthase